MIKKKSMLCLHHGCPYCPEMALPVAIHNIKTMFDLTKHVHIVYTDIPILKNPVEEKLNKHASKEGSLYCPMGFFEGILFNYLRSVRHLVTYLKSFFDTD